MRDDNGMTRTQEQLEQATAEAESWLDSLDPATTSADDITDLRAIAQVVDALARDEARLTEAVTAARVHGRSWGMVARALGVTRQAAQQRYGTLSAAD